MKAPSAARAACNEHGMPPLPVNPLWIQAAPILALSLRWTMRLGASSVRDRWNKIGRRGARKSRVDRIQHGDSVVGNPQQYKDFNQAGGPWGEGSNRGRSVRKATGPKRGGGGSRLTNGGGRGFQDRSVRNGQSGGSFWKPKPDAKPVRREWEARGNSGTSSRNGSMDHRGKKGEEWAGRQLRKWTLTEGLEEWAWSPGKYTFGSGHKCIVLERDAEPGVWRVSPAFGCRFSPIWLEAMSDWVQFFRSALVEQRTKGSTRQAQRERAISGSTRKSESISNQPCPQTNQYWSNFGLQRAHSAGEIVTSGAFSMPTHSSILAQLEQCRRRGSWSICGASSDLSSGLSGCYDDPTNETVASAFQILEPRTVSMDEPCFESDGGSVTGKCLGDAPNPKAGEAHQPRKCIFGEKLNLLETDKVCVSIRCEKMGITDMEADMLAKWIEDHKDSVIVVKLWLFDNKLTDLGAKHVTQMMHDGLMELHLSHNTLTNAGAELVISSISIKNTIGKPLWLRMEWNMLAVDNLMKFLKKQEEQRGLVVDIPKFLLNKVKGKMSSHLMNEKIEAHVQIPWIRSQRLKPSEAPVLMAAKTSWTKSRAPGPEPKINIVPGTSSPSSGPLLIFPDTSALLGLIGISRKGQRSAVFTFDWLQSLCMKGVFGKNLPAHERVFFVLCDSVAKQLDGLKKQNPYVGHSIRKLLSSGLDQYGPGGDDFVTVLGAHEGEGMVVERNADVLDARSHNVHDKGQATDLKIVEVALFFQQELCKKPGVADQIPFSIGDSSSTQKLMIRPIIPDGQDPMRFPVVLLSNDNVQLMAAKSHGLPAYRFTDFSKVRNLRTKFDQNNPLTASAVRRMMEGWATRGLGESARKSLQGEFDGAVACIKHLLLSYEGALRTTDRIREVLKSNADSTALVDQIRSVLDPGIQLDSNDFVHNGSLAQEVADFDGSSSLGSCSPGNSEASDMEDGGVALENGEGSGETSEESGVSPSGPSYVVSEAGSTSTSAELEGCQVSDNELGGLVRAKLVEWEGLVKSYQDPSRVLRWITGMPNQGLEF